MTRIETPQYLALDGRKVEWRPVSSASAKKLRIKIGPEGLQVVIPTGRDMDEAASFIADNRVWVAEQLERTRQLLAVRRQQRHPSGRIAFRGNDVDVRVARSVGRHALNRVLLGDGVITIVCSQGSPVPVSRSLENWLRRQARDYIEQRIAMLVKRIRRTPNRVYVMGQRTKWGNCSALGNLSFNWRLIMAPDYVLQYIVTHEMVHLAVPDHSKRFWLMVQSLCPQSERARQWLVASSDRLYVDLGEILA